MSVTSSLSPSHTLASEVCEETEARGSQTTKSRFSSFSSSSSAQQKHRDKRAFFWNRALVRLRNSFRSGNKISSDSSLPPRQKASSSSAQENSACVRLSTSTSVEEDFVWHELWIGKFGWQSEIEWKILSTQCTGAWNTKSQMATRVGRDPVVQSEASIQVTWSVWTNQGPGFHDKYLPTYHKTEWGKLEDIEKLRITEHFQKCWS